MQYKLSDLDHLYEYIKNFTMQALPELVFHSQMIPLVFTEVLNCFVKNIYKIVL